MANASWSMLEDTWSNAIGAVFGSDAMAMFGFFAIFGVYIATRMGLSIEVALPFAGIFIFLLLMTVPSAAFIWTIFLVITAVIVTAALGRIIGSK